VKGLAVAGATLGFAVAVVAFAPAAWLASAVDAATGSRLVLADARGTVWSGSAVPVLTGGVGSRDAASLPGRLDWTLGLDGAALGLRARHACCINGELRLRIVPGIGRLRIELPGSATPGAAIGQWPAAWLAGLGTPWNTLQPSGSMQLSSPGLVLEQAQGRWRLEGRAELALNSMASRVSTLDVLGSYRLSVDGGSGAAGGADVATLNLATTSGALLLQGSGQIVASRLRFSGQASAAPGSETVLNNLLNIIGRRQGALAVISIG
jgi:general secretion pathway protein N